MDRRPGALAVLGAFLAKRRPPALLRTDRPRGPPGHHLTCLGGLFVQVPIPELRVVPVCVEQRVRSVRRGQVGSGYGRLQPPVVLLAGDLEDPARHRDGDPVIGQLEVERAPHFLGRFAWDR